MSHELVKPGIYPNMPMADYLAIKAFSGALAKTILSESPLHAWIESPWNPDLKREENATADIGTVMHDLLVGGEGKVVVIDPADYRSKPTKDNPDGNIPVGWTNNAIRAARDDAYASDKTPILKSDFAEAEKAYEVAKAFIAKSPIAGIFEHGAGEQTVIWKEGDVLCKARPDWLTDNIVLHYKTTQKSVHPDAFVRVVDSMGYDLSVAFYSEGLAALEGVCRKHLILAQEQQSPFSCSLFSLDELRMTVALGQIKRAIDLWAQCQKRNRWPDYDAAIVPLGMSNWQLQRAEEMGLLDEISWKEPAHASA